MELKQPKKLLIVNILDILRKYSDEEHRLSQREITELLKSEYGMVADRKAIRRNILGLMECGYEIEYKESERMVPNPKTGEPEKSYIWSDFYLVRDFTDAELRLLIDSVLSSGHIPHNQRLDLMKKLEGLSSKYFRAHVRHIHTVTDPLPRNQQLFMTIETLDEAISSGKKVAFNYLEYGTDKKEHRKRRPDGSVREYVVSPYQMAVKEGKYYLICNYDKYDDISNYRVERISNIQLLEEPAKPFASLHGADGQHLNLQKYMSEHIYMYAGGSVRARFRIWKPLVSDVLELFGPDVSFSDEEESYVTVAAWVTERAMEQFAKNFGPDVLVLEPKTLVDSVRQSAEELLQAYSSN